MSLTKNIITDLRDAAAARGATVKELGNGHYQIRGRLLVNYYPESKRRTAYVGQTTHGRTHVSPTEAVDMAFTPPPIVDPQHKDKRSKSTRNQRRALINKNGPFCYWCTCKLTLDSSTIDHVVPLIRGGLDNANNRVLSCSPCNKGRGCDMPELAVQP